MTKIKQKMPKKKKIILITSIAVAVVLVLSLFYVFGVGGILCAVAVDSHASLSMGNMTGGSGVFEEAFKEASLWWDSTEHDEVTVTSDDNLKLTGYRFMQDTPSDKWAIVIHGYRGQGSQTAIYGKNYYEKGFNVLAPDLRAHGKSEGRYIGMGWLDRLDMLHWIDLLIQQNANAKIVMHGVSMGASTTMMTTGEELPANVVGAVADCGYTSVYDQFAFVSEEYIGVPSWLTMPQGNLMINLVAGYDTKEASSVDQLKKSVTPTLFLHGTADTFVPYHMLQINYAACAAPIKMVEKIEGAVHGAAAIKNPVKYWTSVDTFLELAGL